MSYQRSKFPKPLRFRKLRIG